MALVDCRDCGHKVSDSAAACPGCGAIRKAYNELNWPAFHMAGAALVISIVSTSLPNSTALWTRLLTIVICSLLILISAWVIPHLTEAKRFKRMDAKRKKYSPRNTDQG